MFPFKEWWSIFSAEWLFYYSLGSQKLGCLKSFTIDRFCCWLSAWLVCEKGFSCGGIFYKGQRSIKNKSVLRSEVDLRDFCHRVIVMPLLALCVPHFPHFSHQFPGLLGVFVMGVAESVSGPQSQDLHHHAFSSAPRPLTFHQFFMHSLLASTLSP